MQPKLPPTLHRLWLTAAALSTLLLTLLIGNFCLPQDKRLTSGMVGHDFLAFYTAGTFVRQHQIENLYDLGAVKAFQHELAARENLEIGDSYGPFWNPPFYAWVFVPISALPYRAALLTWEFINLTCLAIALFLLARILRNAIKPNHPAPPWRIWALAPILIITSMPFTQALTHGQNTGTSLLLLSLTVTFWRNRQPILAGLFAALLLYKPQLGLLIAIAVAITLGRRAAASIAITSLALFLINLLTLPGTITAYQAKMPGNLILFQVTNPYLWDRHANFRAFWRLLLQGRDPGEMTLLAKSAWLSTTAALGAILAYAGWHYRAKILAVGLARRVQPDPASDLTPIIAATIAAMPLLMPFYFDYDLLLLAVPATLYAAIRLQSQGSHPTDRYLSATWITLYLWLMFNATIARLSHVNITVILLSIIAVLLARRATPRNRNVVNSTSNAELLTRGTGGSPVVA